MDVLIKKIYFYGVFTKLTKLDLFKGVRPIQTLGDKMYTSQLLYKHTQFIEAQIHNKYVYLVVKQHTIMLFM